MTQFNQNMSVCKLPAPRIRMSINSIVIMALHRVRTWPKPTTPAFNLSLPSCSNKLCMRWSRGRVAFLFVRSKNRQCRLLKAFALKYGESQRQTTEYSARIISRDYVIIIADNVPSTTSLRSPAGDYGSRYTLQSLFDCAFNSLHDFLQSLCSSRS